MKNVSMYCGYQKKSIRQLSIFCLIQGINNNVQINTYWRYIVRITASNILLLVSKNYFPTSQGLVGAGMNCRALDTLMCFSLQLLNFHIDIEWSCRSSQRNLSGLC